MAYFADLSEYGYGRNRLKDEGAGLDIQNAGWLCASHPFECAEPAEQLLDVLWSYLSIVVSQTRGVHECEFCGATARHEWFTTVSWNGATAKLGTAEMVVFGAKSTVYVAPDLIFHYAQAHRYKPPEPFIAAMANGPRPGSRAYRDRLTALGVSFLGMSFKERCFGQA